MGLLSNDFTDSEMTSKFLNNTDARTTLSGKYLLMRHCIILTALILILKTCIFRTEIFYTIRKRNCPFAEGTGTCGIGGCQRYTML